MTLYMIGIGIGDEKDISLKGLEKVKECDKAYLENYTSKLNCSIEEMEKLYNKKIILANREMVENGSEIIENSQDKDVAFLVIGDIFGATTHIDLVMRAKEKKIPVKFIHNTSILTAIGETGLELYKFGKVTSIPFENENIKTPIDVFNNNYDNGLHTLFLLDLDPKNKKYMTINEAIEYLVKNGLDRNLLAIGCAGLGNDGSQINSGKLKELKEKDFRVYPQCLIIPSKLHFMEEEYLSKL